MRISRVVIENFRCYYGENEVLFNNIGKITLIYGDSGFGKSSFLQFFRWMFYNDPDFGKNDDKPLFNISAYNEKGVGDHVEVRGVIEFEHVGVRYSLERCEYYSVTMNPKNSRLEKTDYTLQTLENDNWVLYNGDIHKKINSIMPKGLSKYFLLDGERARDIVLNSSELKIAINSLFGIDAYESAINHIGKSAYSKKSVVGYYSNLKASQITYVPTSKTDLTPAEFQDTLEDLHEEIENLIRLRKDLMDQMGDLQNRRDEILKTLGEVNNKASIQEIIKRNEADIKEKEKRIDAAKTKIGNLYYKCFPYLLLTSTTSKSAKALREQKEKFELNYHNTFNTLKKELLKEILEKNTCVCGRELDAQSIEYINSVIDVMPPNSYSYQFAQFVSNSKKAIQNAKLRIYGYDDIVDEITGLQEGIRKLEESNQEKINDLKRLDDAKDLVDELEEINKEYKGMDRQKVKFEGDIAKKRQTFNIADQQYKKMVKNNEVSAKYDKIISFFKQICEELEKEKQERELQVAQVLNNCVRDVFKKLTTQTELDADRIQFVNRNFSLRTTYLTGGQLAIDEYSYVIGIIKALQEFNMDNNENPIIIDAPFAFTGNEQSEHIFKTLPTVVKQTILLTLDLNKIKNLLGDTNLYEFYVIRNDSQEKATIERGDINDFEF